MSKKILDGTATDKEIREHGLDKVSLVSPDYVFENDFDERLKYKNELNERKIDVN